MSASLPGKFSKALFIAGVAVFPGAMHAADWRITPRTDFTGTYTDNNNLSSTNDESAFITGIRPGISADLNAARVRLFADYGLELLSTAGGDDGDGGGDDDRRLNQQLNANGTVEWLQDFFFTDASASIFQQNTSIFGPIARDNTNDTGNRSDVKTFSLSPYLKRNLGSLLNYEARYTYGVFDSDQDIVGNGDLQRIDLIVDSGRAFQTQFGVEYFTETQTIDGNRDDVTRESVAGNARYPLTSRLNLLATVGHEDNDFLTLREDPTGGFYSVGASWAPTPRTQLEARVGERFFGSTAFLDLNHRTRRTIWNLSYTEEIATTQQSFFFPATPSTATFLDDLFAPGIPDPIARAQAVRDFITANGLPANFTGAQNFFTNDVFLEERLQLLMTVNLPKNTVTLSVFNQKRDSLTEGLAGVFGGGDFALADVVEERGFSAGWVWRFAPRTRLNTDFTFSKVDSSGIDRDDDIFFFRTGVSHDIARNVTAGIFFRRNERESSAANAEFAENAITGFLGIVYR
ncbi:MAG TPA: TIGR03016 family PEP-CTERM system-associated outer membrane protein [Burkholderiales bacterium]|nr:TIGR03016 family PEP-CTERM system-associated outer membrane protein [Burkholderiales bacterium]